jgi:hypothetical protein
MRVQRLAADQPGLALRPCRPFEAGFIGSQHLIHVERGAVEAHGIAREPYDPHDERLADEVGMFVARNDAP